MVGPTCGGGGGLGCVANLQVLPLPLQRPVAEGAVPEVLRPLPGVGAFCLLCPLRCTPSGSVCPAPGMVASMYAVVGDVPVSGRCSPTRSFQCRHSSPFISSLVISLLSVVFEGVGKEHVSILESQIMCLRHHNITPPKYYKF